MSAGRRGGPGFFRAPHLGRVWAQGCPPPFLSWGEMFSFYRPTFCLPMLGAKKWFVPDWGWVQCLLADCLYTVIMFFPVPFWLKGEERDVALLSWEQFSLPGLSEVGRFSA